VHQSAEPVAEDRGGGRGSKPSGELFASSARIGWLLIQIREDSNDCTRQHKAGKSI
jgi:hypothetical protein